MSGNVFVKLNRPYFRTDLFTINDYYRTNKQKNHKYFFIKTSVVDYKYVPMYHFIIFPWRVTSVNITLIIPSKIASITTENPTNPVSYTRNLYGFLHLFKAN